MYGGSEDAELTALNTAYQKQDPILMYFWTPHWAQAKYDLTNVELPRSPKRARTRPLTTPTQYDCATRTTILYKAFNAELQDEGSGGVRFPERVLVHGRRPERRSRWTSTTGMDPR